MELVQVILSHDRQQLCWQFSDGHCQVSMWLVEAHGQHLFPVRPTFPRALTQCPGAVPRLADMTHSHCLGEGPFLSFLSISIIPMLYNY